MRYIVEIQQKTEQTERNGDAGDQQVSWNCHCHVLQRT